MSSKRSSMAVVVACLAAALVGCATLDRSTESRFEMVTDSSWRLWARTSSNYAPDSERAEAIRMGWIRTYTEANDCRSFQVTDRRWTKEPTDNIVRTGFSQSMGALVYTGTCER